MSYLTMNLKVLLWKCKGELSNRTYEQYIEHVAGQCHMTNTHFRSALLDQEAFKPEEIAALRVFFEDTGYELSAIEHDFQFADLMRRDEKKIIDLNLQYLLRSLEWGDNAAFVEAIQVNPSTLSRWKQGTTRPDRDSQRRICQYFGYPDAEILKSGFLFLGLTPVSDQQKRDECKKQIDKLSKEDFDKLYPALMKLLR